MIRQLTIIGVGLIGGSLARGLRVAGAVNEIVGCSRDVAHLERARKLGIIDRYTTAIAQAITGADIVVLGMPVGAVEMVSRALAPHLDERTILTDVGSTKGSVITAVKQGLGYLPPRFIPGHPIAGTEESGVEAAFADLYQGQRVILTPLPESEQEALMRVRWMWEQVGAEVSEMSAQYHDEVLAAVSHLPHMLAFALVDALARLDEHDDILRFAASGFHDFTRIASSDPQMWHDICLANSEALLRMVRHYMDELESLAAMIRCNDSTALLELLTRANRERGKIYPSPHH